MLGTEEPTYADPDSDLQRAAGAWRDAGWRVGRQALRLRDPDLEGANLVAIAEGRSDQAIVVVAHHDTVNGSPGADDNGAALAIMLELAARFEHHRFTRTV